MAPVLGLATLDTDLSGALELGTRALAHAESSGLPVLASASFESEALVLGALQCESSLRSRSPARFDQAVVRRATTGTEAQLSGPALYHALALPHVSSLFADASPRTLLNRNLRALLRGYAAAGVPLRYFGTEVLALSGQPVALIGYDRLASGAVLIEVLIGLENPCVVRSALQRGPAASLWSVVQSRSAPRELLERAVSGVVARLSVSGIDVTAELPAAPMRTERDWSSRALSQIAIPLGVIEASTVPEVRLGGDLLGSLHAMRGVETAAAALLAVGQPLSPAVLAPLSNQPLDGARPADVLAVLNAAAAQGS